jgi:hypothetical protein
MTLFSFYKPLFFGYLVTPFILSSGLYTLAMAPLAAITVWRIPSKKLFAFILPLLLVFLISTHGLWSSFTYYEVFKDFWYLLNPLLAFYVGCFFYLALSRQDFYYIFCIAGIFLALMHLAYFAINPEVLSLGGRDIRDLGVKGNHIIPFTVALLLWGGTGRLFHLRLEALLFAVFLLIISVALSFSRTGWLILIFSLFVYFEFYRKPALILFLVLIVLILSFLVVGGYETNNPLLNKFMNPTSEFIQFDNWNIYDINNNWRGYENFLTREVLENAPFLTQLFGFGAGYSLPLDVTIKLGGDVHSEIFILHSAYSYLLLKTGIIGVLLYLFFLLHLFYIAIRARDMEARSVLVIAGIIFFTSFAISGLYNKVQAIPFMIFLGCSINIFWERKR